MSRTAAVLVVVALAALGCKGKSERTRGPALTPLVANQLKAIAPECEIRAAQGAKGTKELRLCKGRQAMMTLHLDDQRNLIEVEIGMWAPLREEARQLLEQTMRGIVSDAAIAAMSARLGNPVSDPVVVDGVRVNAFHTREPNENARYTVTFSW